MNTSTDTGTTTGTGEPLACVITGATSGIGRATASAPAPPAEAVVHLATAPDVADIGSGSLVTTTPAEPSKKKYDLAATERRRQISEQLTEQLDPTPTKEPT